MWPFKKKRTAYTRPTGLRTCKIWLVAISVLKHPIPVYLILGMVGLILFQFLLALLFLKSSFFTKETGAMMLLENYAEVSPKVSLFINTIAFGALAVPLLGLLTYMIFHAMPTAHQIGSRIFTGIFAFFSLTCLLMASPESLAFAMCCMGTFMLINSLALAVVLRCNSIITVLYAVSAFVILGVFTENAEAIEEYFSTFTLDRIEIITTQIAIGMAVWLRTMRYLRCDWRSSSDFLIAMQKVAKPNLYPPTYQHRKEFWLYRWFYRETDQCCQKLEDRTVWTMSNRSQLFALVNRPPRLFLIALGLAFTLAITIIYSACTGCSSDIGVNILVGIYCMVMSTLCLVMFLAVQWKRSFSFESLLPMSRTDYVRAMVMSHFKIVMTGLLPYIVVVTPVVLFFNPMLLTPKNLVFTVLFFVAWLSISLGISIIGTTISGVATIPAWPVITFVLFWRMRLDIHAIFIWDFVSIIMVGVILFSVGIWRLHHIEPDRVKL